MNPSKSLVGKVAVITGSTSGIGKTTALELARHGADCLIHGRANREGAEQAVKEINDLGVKADLMMVDLADKNAAEEIVQKAFQWQSKIDIWVNNAGADVLTTQRATDSFEQKLEYLWQIDVLSAVKLTRLVGQKMKTQGSGCIVNIGWDQATIGMEGDSGEMFSTIKGAIMAFTLSAAKTLAPEVRVNCVAPGWIQTSWGESASDDWQQRAVGESLLKRWGTPQDVAATIRFLVSSDAAFITGHTLPVNGGFDPSSTRENKKQ